MNGEHHLDRSLRSNGISKKSLDEMWSSVDSNLDMFLNHILHKQFELKKGKLTWHELTTLDKQGDMEITFSETVNILLEALSMIDNEMKDFVEVALREGWVDAEDREGKHPGGFCAPFLAEGESRISLIYDNSLDSARRLAHELGHAWHFHQMRNQESVLLIEDTFEITSAETASIFFETVFIDYLLTYTENVNQKKFILNLKIDKSLHYLMSIRSAFIFEQKVYEHAKKFSLNARVFESISMKSQKESYRDTLAEYEPYKWLKYGQFFQSDVPFYNYPYSFGFLMSRGLLAKAKQSSDFAKTFNQFLEETGMLPLETLINKYLDIDVTNRTFWDECMESLTEDIKLFNSL